MHQVTYINAMTNLMTGQNETWLLTGLCSLCKQILFQTQFEGELKVGYGLSVTENNCVNQAQGGVVEGFRNIICA